MTLIRGIVTVAVVISAAVVGTPTYAGQPDETWRPNAKEAYDPSTYCSWNRTGLPPAQQKICSDRDRKYGVYKSNWRKIEADNGAVFAIDLNSIQPMGDGAVDVITCAVDNNICPPMNMKRLLFDCQGHYMDESFGSPILIVPPRSVVGQMAALVCAHNH